MASPKKISTKIVLHVLNNMLNVIHLPRRKIFITALTTISLCSPLLQAHELDGYIGLEGRYHWQEALFEEQQDAYASLTSELKYFHDFNEGDQRIAFTATARADSEDSERTHADIGELYWWKNFNAFEMYLGVQTIFWGVTESVHLVDVINQTNTLENIDGEDKLGQPMLRLVTSQDWGVLSAFIMPVFREREFVGPESRFRFGLPLHEEALYQSDDEENHIDLAARWSHYYDIWDFGLSYFTGTSRSPLFVPVIENNAAVALQAYYPQIEQSGIDVQATIEAWLLKFEAISIKEETQERNSAAALGVEYTFFTVGGTNADLGIVAEYQYDDRENERAVTSQNDIVLGARYAFNDLDGSEILALTSYDLDDNSRFFSVEVSRRLTDKWKLEAEARIFSSIDPQAPEYLFRYDDYVQIELRRYF